MSRGPATTAQVLLLQLGGHWHTAAVAPSFLASANTHQVFTELSDPGHPHFRVKYFMGRALSKFSFDFYSHLLR